ncbi:MAG: M20/M25/M40 family metallo-hydrolase [Oscillospiraceae bacterium]|nr:M20/M25/M40 family metallo-hydrolase [Oscillospiraceae bacterium]
MSIAQIIGWSLLALVVLFKLVSCIRALFFKPKKRKIPVYPDEEIDAERAAKNLSQAIAIPTVSYPEHERVDWVQFERFHAFLQQSYPLVHQHCTREVVPPASLLYHWPGKNSSLEPMALLAHMDVVPVETGTEADWTHPPFSGHNDGEFIWGRGSVDMKNHLVCIFEAAETLLAEGYIPERDIYICLGDDEEVVAGGNSGASKIRETLIARGVTKLSSTLDEGGAVLPIPNVPGVFPESTLAGVGVSEKGFADIEIAVTSRGGHSSAPPNHTAVGAIAEVVRDLERNQFKSKLLPHMVDIIDQASRRMPVYLRAVMVNHKLMKPLLLAVMKKIPQAACMIRTCTAVTMAQGSPASNVLPQRASIVANFRMMPGTTTDDVIKHIRRVVRNKNIEIKVLRDIEASPFSSTDHPAYQALHNLILHASPDAMIVPYLVMGGTDTVFYEPICNNCYRFSPFFMPLELLMRTHATNECLALHTLGDGVKFFKRYIRAAADAQ